MEPIHEDFQEAELFDDFSDNPAGSQSEELAFVDTAKAPLDARRTDDQAESSEKSSLTNAVLDAASDVAQDATEGSEDQMADSRSVAASLPVTPGPVRMGSSVPVSIPHMSRWKKADEGPESPTGQFAPATFIPPHQMSQTNEFMFSITGDSPSVSIKRDRLRVRNAILKSTGFLEPGVEPVNNIGLQERNRLVLNTGGLSQALSQQLQHTAISNGVIAAAAMPSS